MAGEHGLELLRGHLAAQPERLTSRTPIPLPWRLAVTSQMGLAVFGDLADTAILSSTPSLAGIDHAEP
ncbi:MAG: hypothetical protein ACRD0K_04245 [Egibacteraceae bacterium]